MSRLHLAALVLVSSELVVGTGFAADLPFRKAAPVDYVRVCDVFGQGFFYIPGTDTCLRVTGQVRAEYSFRGNAPTNYSAANSYNQAGQVYRRDLTNFRARGYLNADTRTQTAYGTLRAFVSLRLTNDTTAPGPSGGRGELGVAGVPTGVRASTGLFQGLNPTGTQAVLDKAFIQFAGITAGRSQSFFDFDAQSYELQTNSVANSNQVTELLAYTATFGNGFSATASVEDAAERRIGDNGSFVRSPTNAFALPNASYNNPVLSTGTAGVLAYAGEQVPDLVANVRYDAAWGSAQLAGAYHQVRSQAVTVLTTPNVASATTTAPSADGFAVLGGVKVLLPMLAKGDSLTVQGTYAEGAMDYVDPINYQPVGLSNVYNNTTAGIPTTFGVPVNDAYTLTNGKIGLSKAAGGYGAFRHYFVPDVYGSLFGDYLSIVTPVQAQRLGTGYDSADIYQIGGNLVWTPVKDFQIGAEVLYTDISYAKANLTAATRAVTPDDVDDYRARLSLRRAF